MRVISEYEGSDQTVRNWKERQQVLNRLLGKGMEKTLYFELHAERQVT
jgi:hypothetical protein